MGPRPTVALSVVNRLAREDDDTVAAFIDATDRVKAAQLGHDGSAADLRSATARQRQVLGTLMRRAEGVLHERSARVSAALLRRIERTLTTAASNPETRSSLRKATVEHE